MVVGRAESLSIGVEESGSAEEVAHMVHASSGIAGLGLLAAAASAPSALDVRLTSKGSDADSEGEGSTADGEGEALVVANAVVEALPQVFPTASEQGQIIARQQKEIASLRELIASQEALIDQLRAQSSNAWPTAMTAPHPHPHATAHAAAHAAVQAAAQAVPLGTSPPPPYGPASPSSELVSVAEELEALSPSSGVRGADVHRPPWGWRELARGGKRASPAPSDGRAAPPTPTLVPTPVARTPPSVGVSDGKRLKTLASALVSTHASAASRAESPPVCAPTPAGGGAYRRVTLALGGERTTLGSKGGAAADGATEGAVGGASALGGCGAAGGVAGGGRGSRTNTHVLWTAEEDACLRGLVGELGEQAWALVASRMPHERNNKQCRERWRNHLRPACNKGPWTAAEDSIILQRVAVHGTKWAKISSLYLPDRPENDIKNRWHILARISGGKNPNGQHAAAVHTGTAHAATATAS